MIFVRVEDEDLYLDPRCNFDRKYYDQNRNFPGANENKNTLRSIQGKGEINRDYFPCIFFFEKKKKLNA